MKANREKKRLFVGGLGQAISKTDLQDQFSRFGDVSEVEIITRKDEQGNPQKVFAYVSISITEADLKKCMSVLNKTKWKGGTLQVQLAKESFLHRLAQEREQAKAKKDKSITDTTLLEKVQGLDFQMKAVPGTEVPGHKNWVVSKFGRVLPVLHLKSQHKHKIMKYDPSKYCHNLKKIGEDFTNTVPITNLTWELEGGNDPMSKKRRGEFSDFRGPPKKIIKVQKAIDSTESKDSDPSSRTSWVMKNNTLTQQKTTQQTACDSITPKSLHILNSISQKPKSTLFQTSSFENARERNSISDDDIDSEDELRMMIAEEENLQRTGCSSINESENDPFEVVRNDFKSDTHKLHSLTELGTNDISSYVSNNIGNDSEYDSGDTDEIIAMKKNIVKVKNCAEFSQTDKSINKKTSLKTKELSNNCARVHRTKTNTESVLSYGVKSPSHKPSPESSSSDSEESEDEEYAAMMNNCPRVTLTLADLEHLACSDQEIPGKDTESDNPKATKHCKLDRTSKNSKTPRVRKCILPEEIVASLLEEENGYEKQKSKESNSKPKFQAFKGLGCLYGKDSVGKPVKENIVFNIHEHQGSLIHVDPNSVSVENVSPCANGFSSKLTSCQPAKKVNSPTHLQLQKKQFAFETQNRKSESSSRSAKESKDPASCLLPLKGKKSLSDSAKTPNIDFDKDTDHSTKLRDTSEEEESDSSSPTILEIPPKVSSRKDIQKSTDDSSLSIRTASDVSTKGKHAEDNQKRLAALEARQKAREMQKKLVHDALAHLDGHSEDKPTHIIFASDDESETEDTSTQEQSCPGEELVKQESIGKTSGKLFDSSDDEESEAEDDDDRFKIKPQFEGRAGQKLMDLQSRFGNDERFRMDSRFLESESEEEQEEVNENKTAEEDELAAERKKALNVVQSVLNINLNNPTSKGSAPAKKFKDIIHYDPTRQDHVTYERKKDDKPKESKAKRKKIREEAEKLPEVSKEMYYNIAMDLKEIFQTTKDNSEEKEDTAWNEDCAGEDSGEIDTAAALTSGTKQTSGFTFSFFDSDTKDVKEDTYRVEAVKPMKIVSQGDARFQDSSSEEDNVTEEADHRKSSSGEEAVPEKETTRFFFFSQNDERLNGSGLFWRGVESNISKTSWEARTNNLLMDCRKKHKEAKRKMKPK